MVELEEDASFENFVRWIHVTWCLSALLEAISIELD